MDEDSNDSSDGLTTRRRGNSARVNYNVKDMTANNKQQLVHDAEGRLVRLVITSYFAMRKEKAFFFVRHKLILTALENVTSRQSIYSLNPTTYTNIGEHRR